MTLVFHVFRKDTRHLWKEIVISLALLAAYAWRVPSDWYPKPPNSYFADRYLHPTLAILLLASWWFLIVRLVHSERLVGDRQFWLTRPYEWKRLLYAKLLFLVAFVHVPLLITQICLLGFAGFTPYAHWYGLLWLHVMTFFTLLLSALVLAAVTATFGQSILALLAVGLYIAGVAVLSELLPGSSLSLSSSVFDDLQILVFVAGCVTIVVLQYSRRRTRASIGVMASIALAIAAIVLGTPYSKLIARAYPEVKTPEKLPVRIAFDPQKPKKPSLDPNRDDGKIGLDIPVYLSSDWEAGVQIRATRVSIDAGGTHWSSDWAPEWRLLMPGRFRLPLDVEIKKKIYEQMQTGAAKVKVVVAFEALRDLQQWQAVAREGDFALPEVGRCIHDRESGDSLKCRAPLRGPQMLVMSVPAKSACPISGDPGTSDEKSDDDAAASQSYSSFLSRDSDPAEFDISPVQAFSISFNHPWTYNPSASLCPGTPIVFNRVEVATQGQVELDIPGVNLADYRRSNRFDLRLAGTE